ncbi:uncharacterized protein LOC121374661 [Gigantopelta aegis]|uniref:uncharacterized protein LOC121374661 n=1 Tax=Gigantopelta aegis TaxID=1735272 RepID=UPI001B889DDB|nr:uncharacterized protein LOC121374661 [Gigantopelta aegis]
MDKTGFGAVIKYLQSKGLTPTAIHAALASTLRDGDPSFVTVDSYDVGSRVQEQKRALKMIQDQDNLQLTLPKKMLIKYKDDRRLTTHHIANTEGIYYEKVKE